MDTVALSELIVSAAEDEIVVVDFWAPWCGPCLRFAPILEDVIANTDANITLVKVNVDDFPGTSTAYGVQGIPTVSIFKNGETTQFTGAVPKDVFKAHLEPFLPKAD